MESVKKDLDKKPYVVSPWGRKRFFSLKDLKHPRERQAVERAAINAPLQAGAGDLIKKAMIKLNKSLPLPLVSQVHDELLFECPEQATALESQEIRAIMEKRQPFANPLESQHVVWKKTGYRRTKQLEPYNLQLNNYINYLWKKVGNPLSLSQTHP